VVHALRLRTSFCQGKFNVDLLWREAVLTDLPQITGIANAAHIALPERQEVFADKISLSPHTSFVLQTDDKTVGYAICHPWELHRVPPLDSFLGGLPHHPDCLYVHDVVVLPAFRGQRAVASFIATISKSAHAKGIRFLALVSVYNTEIMWERLGFRVTQANPALTAKLLSYGDTAKYMVCDLDAR
jgi:ribosomal protein S18 acetylase RimI-like enzyme